MNHASAYPIAPPAQATASLQIAGHSHLFPVGRVFCIGRNYPWTPEEKSSPKVMPSWFMKPNSAVVPAEGLLPYPSQTDDFCHEVELVVGLQKGGMHIEAGRVEDEYIWGYAVGLDLTRRDLQKLAKQKGDSWEPAKAFDFSAPCSAIVPASVSGHPSKNAIWLKVNGQEKQKDSIAHLLFSVPELVAMLSQFVELRAGDLIFTGTPSGVGPLNPHDRIDAGIEGIGEISMRVGIPA